MTMNKTGQAPLEITAYALSYTMRNKKDKTWYTNTTNGLRKRRRRFLSLTGQAATEMAVFGSIILVIFSSLLVYNQMQNEEQYVTMEAFRRALQTANGVKAGDEGASVSLNVIQYRRFADVFSNFWQGNRNMLSAGASVYWAVPNLEDEKLKNLSIVRLNEDPKDLTTVLRLDDSDTNNDLQLRDITIAPAEMNFSETTDKIEDKAQIQNIRSSDLSESITTNLEIVDPGLNKDSEGDDIAVRTISINQRLYRDSDGQYKYKSGLANQPITRQKKWVTPH